MARAAHSRNVSRGESRTRGRPRRDPRPAKRRHVQPVRCWLEINEVHQRGLAEVVQATLEVADLGSPTDWMQADSDGRAR